MSLAPVAEQKERAGGSQPAATTLTVLMPAYNEGNHIAANLTETLHTLSSALGNRGVVEIVLIDDGSSDDTLAEATRISQTDRRVKVAHLRENNGKGRALQVGAIYATGDLIAFLDADLELHPQQLLSLLNAMQETGADIVIGSKMHPRSVVNYPWQRRVLSFGYYVLVRLLFGLPVRDTQTGIKLFTRKALSDTMHRIVVKRFAYDLELLTVAHMRGYKIAEVPVTMNYARRFGRIGMRDVWNIMVDTAAIFYRRNLLRYYDR